MSMLPRPWEVAGTSPLPNAVPDNSPFWEALVPVPPGERRRPITFSEIPGITDTTEDRMTTTQPQPPLNPGDRVLVEFEAIVAGAASAELLSLVPVAWNGEPDHLVRLAPARVRWHPMPAEDSPDAAKLAIAQDGWNMTKAELDRVRRMLREETLRADSNAAEIQRLLQALDAPKDSPDAAHVARLDEGQRGPLTLARLESAMDAGELQAQLDAVRRDRDALDDLIDRMRPVVAAAEAWRDILSANAADLLVNPIRRAVVLAVDAYRAGQTAPEMAPGATLSHERGPVGESGDEAGRPSTEPTEALRTSEAVDLGTALFVDSMHGQLLGAIAGLSEPATIQPQPTDAPGRRDWAREILAALKARADANPDELSIKWGTLAEYLADALGLPALEDERDEANFHLRRAAIAMARDEDGAATVSPADLAELITDLHGRLDDAQEQRDEAAGKYDALLAGVLAAADRIDTWDGFRDFAADLRTLAAPPTTTPDGTGTAETKRPHRAGCICVECEDGTGTAGDGSA